MTDRTGSDGTYPMAEPLAPSRDLAEALKAVRIRFAIELSPRAADLSALLDRLDGADAPKATLREACRIAHRLAGTAGTLGFAALGRCAAEADEAAERALAAPDRPARLALAMVRLRALAEAMRKAAGTSGDPTPLSPFRADA